MPKSGYIVALDQGTTSSRTIVYDLQGREKCSSSQILPLSYPADAWVEQDANQIWSTQLATLREACGSIEPSEIKAIGITNQRETVIAWDKLSGEPLAPAIVWQCRRSAAICEEFRAGGQESLIKDRTGLVLDPYFSASKIKWLLDNVAELREKVSEGRAVFGTVDSWLMYKLTQNNAEATFATEASNASRTMLYSLSSSDWDPDLMDMFQVARRNLADIRPSASLFAETDVLGTSLPVTAVLGDQQASLFGHGCCSLGEAKCTFGTGAFLLVNQGTNIARSDAGLLSTAAWTIDDGSGEVVPSFALEGSVFIAGAAVQWLRDGLGILPTSEESEQLASSVPDSAGVIVVPAFVGLGSPHWDERARGLVIGLTRDTTSAHIVRAALEGIAHQVADVLATEDFSGTKTLRVDGGMVKNALFCQILANLTGLKILVSASAEMTAYGVARLATIGAGVYSDLEQALANFSGGDAASKSYQPLLSTDVRETERGRWAEAVKRSKGWSL